MSDVSFVDFNCLIEFSWDSMDEEPFEEDCMLHHFNLRQKELGLQKEIDNKFMIKCIQIEDKHYIEFQNEHLAEYGLLLGPWQFDESTTINFNRHHCSTFTANTAVVNTANFEEIYGCVTTPYIAETILARRVYINQNPSDKNLKEKELVLFLNSWFQRLIMNLIPSTLSVLYAYLDVNESFVEMRTEMDALTLLNMHNFVFNDVKFTFQDEQRFNNQVDFYEWDDLLKMEKSQCIFLMDAGRESTIVKLLKPVWWSDPDFVEIVCDIVVKFKASFESSVPIVYAYTIENTFFFEMECIYHAKYIIQLARAKHITDFFAVFHDEWAFAHADIANKCDMMFFLSKSSVRYPISNTF